MLSRGRTRRSISAPTSACALVRSCVAGRLSRNSAVVLKVRPRRIAVSAVMPRVPLTMALIRFAGTCSAAASLLALRASGHPAAASGSRRAGW